MPSSNLFSDPTNSPDPRRNNEAALSHSLNDVQAALSARVEHQRGNLDECPSHTTRYQETISAIDHVLYDHQRGEFWYTGRKSADPVVLKLAATRAGYTASVPALQPDVISFADPEGGAFFHDGLEPADWDDPVETALGLWEAPIHALAGGELGDLPIFAVSRGILRQREYGLKNKDGSLSYRGRLYLYAIASHPEYGDEAISRAFVHLELPYEGIAISSGSGLLAGVDVRGVQLYQHGEEELLQYGLGPFIPHRSPSPRAKSGVIFHTAEDRLIVQHGSVLRGFRVEAGRSGQLESLPEFHYREDHDIKGLIPLPGNRFGLILHDAHRHRDVLLLRDWKEPADVFDPPTQLGRLELPCIDAACAAPDGRIALVSNPRLNLAGQEDEEQRVVVRTIE